MTHAVLVRRRLRVGGIVQGVGFRPHVHHLANDEGLAGFVGNDSAGVFIEVEGPEPAIDRFVHRLTTEAPPLATIESVTATNVDPAGEVDFRIVDSVVDPGSRTPIPPDVALCDECRREMTDPSDRRHRYPFINCTNCGPRFTIIRDLPYDRRATTMAGFAMCEPCRAEYDDPADRRHHAQPVACPTCGPQLRFAGAAGELAGTDAVVAATQHEFGRGGIVAVKGIGGFHLACDAANETAVAAVRERKGRVDKPFAVMVPDLDAVRAIAHVDELEIEALTAPARPVVLVRRRADAELSDAVAPANPLIGVMLPYSPLHHLLFDPVPGASTAPPRVLVMTSANRSNEPICHTDADARVRLAELADAFCTHDRPIETPCDDSVVRIVDGAVQPIRRSRGYAPVPVALPIEVPPVLGVGGELKNTFCLAAGRHAWISQHIGDMENLETLDAFTDGVAGFERMYDLQPVAFGVDQHPGYLSRRWALDNAAGRSVIDVQHHHAHVAAVMAEHGLDGTAPVIGIAFDGTGHGLAGDGSAQAWGGEFLLADYEHAERAAHLRPLPLPGGNDGVRNPCRLAVAYLAACGIDTDETVPAVAACSETERTVIRRQVERMAGCVPTTSMGRLFDVVASILGVRHRITYEAQAAIELEALAATGIDHGRLDFALDDGQLDPTPVLQGLMDGLAAGTPTADLAADFHGAVTRAIVATVVGIGERTGVTTVALTGGVFQNALLAQATTRMLTEAGLRVLSHRLVPANDGGLALGQAIVAGARRRAAAQERNQPFEQEEED